MRYPEFLREGGRIGLIAPSFGCASMPYLARFENALERMKEWGYSVTEGPNCRKELGIGKSNTPEACADEINDFFLNDRSDVIISCGGGETMCEDLPFVDFAGIAKAKPKWYMGYSDNTNLTFTLATICDTASVYGPGISAFGMEPLHKSLVDAMDILTGKCSSVENYDKWQIEDKRDDEHPLEPYNLTRDFCMRTFIGGKELTGDEASISFSGRLIGGCMDCLVNLIGTPFDKAVEFAERYKEDGIIWFIESCDLNVMDCRRALWQMSQAGWFRYVKGFLIGRPLHYDDAFGDYDMGSAFTDMLGQYGVPVLTDTDLGHLPPMMPIVSGAKALIKAGEKKLKVSYVYE